MTASPPSSAGMDAPPVRRPPAHGDDRLLRLGTLIALRWMAVAGQTLTVLAVHFGLKMPVPLSLCFLAIAVSVWVNVGLRIRFPVSKRLSDRAAALLLAYDIVQLSALLFLTGGITNPFALFLIAPVLVSAAALPVTLTVLLGGLAGIAASVLALWHWPLPWRPGDVLAVPHLLVAGAWVSLLLALGFTALYARQVAQDARNLSQALAATELVLAREKHLSQLDGLAAAAAHELGTPLATIALVARELERTVPPDAPYFDDIALMREQTARCRDILGTLRSLSSGDGGPLAELTLPALVEEVVEPLKSFDVVLAIDSAGDGPAPVCRRNPGMLYGLENLIENAVDFARTQVAIEARWSASAVSVTIRDDGPGIAEDVLARLGEPFVRSRSDARRAKGVSAGIGGGIGEGSEEGGGLGLGFFIAKTLLERTGAQVRIANRDGTGGAEVAVLWPRPAFEARDH